MSEAVLRARHLATARGGRPILRGIDLEVARGEVLVVVGPSGGGKTTLLRAFNYLTPFDAGEVEIAGHRLTPGLSERRDATLLRAVRMRVGLVFQSFNLFPHLSALENVSEAPRRVLGLDPGAAAARGRKILERVGLGEMTDRYPHTLSGGQQQRVAIARALAMEPTVLLLDEPTSALDPRLADEVWAVVSSLAAGGQTMLVVTHELRLARRIGHRLAAVVDGAIAEIGPTAQILDRPETAVAREFLHHAATSGDPH